MRATSRLKPALLVAGAFAAMAGLDGAGLMDRPNHLLAEARMAAAERPVTGRIAHLAIDKKSLDAIGVWPWPREIHARIVEALVAAEAAEIALDIDFSLLSRPEGDLALAAALEAAGGSVILPAFPQLEAAGGGRVGYNVPHPMFAEHAWIGSAGLRADADGVVRRFPYGLTIAGEDVPSVPALLGGALGGAGAEVTINFALDPDTVPVFSVIDLLEGRVGAGELSGRSVLVGAQAVELGDNFTVPVHGILTGSTLQILAAETIAQDVALVTPRGGGAPLVLAALLAFAVAARWSGPLAGKLAILAAVGAAAEAAALLAQAQHSIVVPTAAGQLTLLGAAVAIGIEELDLRRWMMRLAQVRALNTERVLRRIVADSSDAILVVDEEGAILELSRTAQGLLGAPAGRLADMAPPEMVGEVRTSIAELRVGAWSTARLREVTVGAGGETRILEFSVTPSRLSRLGKRGRAAEEDAFVACVTARDVTEKRRHLARLDYLSRFDEATGAMRRGEFLARLEAAFAAWPAPGGSCAVFVLNLHRFKTVNEAFGRQMGDMVLASVARRLDGCDPRLSAPARLDGDAFAVFTRAAVREEEAAAIAGMLAELVTAPFAVGGTTAKVGAQIGMSLADPAAGRAPGAVLAEAESALDQARRAGGNAAKLYEPASGARQERRRFLEGELWGALERGELHLLYQPQVRLSDLRLTGAEALVRWRHPRLGPVSPGEFIEIAEANGFIEELGTWVLETACASAAKWPAELSVAVNVSPLQFTRRNVIADVRRALSDAGLPATRLHLEITESTFLAPTSGFLELLADLRLTGVSLALDDFGSGFSSLGYLARFPLDKIKLDQMFIRRLGQERASEAILKSVRLLADELGTRLICEGVETEAQLAYLRQIGCHDGQGYLFGRPAPEEDLLALWRAQQGADAPGALAS